MFSIPRLLLVWAGIEAFYAFSLILLPHHPVELAGFLSYSLQSLLFLVSLMLVMREPTNKNKFIFVNFSVLFAISFLAHLHNFVGTLIPGELFASDGRFARLVLDQYVFRGAYFFLLSLAVVYVSMDLLFRDTSAGKKYFAATLIVGTFFGFYYAPFVNDPLYLHHTPLVEDWRKLDDAFTLYKDVNGREPSYSELAKVVRLRERSGVEAGDALSDAVNNERVAALYPYLFGKNWQILVYRPLNLNQIFMSVLCVGFILLFFGYQFLKDPPQGAYIEKIMFLLLVFCSLEIFHGWISIQVFEWSVFTHMFVLGQFVSVIVMALMALFFLLRLKFITSVNGEFYEQELASRPASITRWRDTVDNLVIQKFFNPKVIIGRMLVDPSRR